MPRSSEGRAAIPENVFFAGRLDFLKNHVRLAPRVSGLADKQDSILIGALSAED